MKKFPILVLTALLLSCGSDSDLADAYGNFEAEVITISSEANGKLLAFELREGQVLEEGQVIGLVDTTDLSLQKAQIMAGINTLPKKLRNTLADIEVLKTKKISLERELARFTRLLDKKAATQKQVDEISDQLILTEKQINAIRSNTGSANAAILAEKEPLLAQVNLIDEQMRKSVIRNPRKGTVLSKLAEQHEVVRMGSPLYRLGNLESMELKFYVSALQLNSVILGNKVQVLVDKSEDEFHEFEGTISWISSEAEFTPKTIQTKEERVNLVYAVKALVKNEGGLIKMGMPGEINFNTVSENGNDSN